MPFPFAAVEGEEESTATGGVGDSGSRGVNPLSSIRRAEVNCFKRSCTSSAQRVSVGVGEEGVEDAVAGPAADEEDEGTADAENIDEEEEYWEPKAADGAGKIE